MNKEVKQEWIAALRSGKYIQGKERLRSGDKFCCLGVLCDIYMKNNNLGEWNNDSFVIYGANYISFPPLEVVDWAELSSIDPRPNTDVGCTLSSWNDSGSSFSDIANIIENSL